MTIVLHLHGLIGELPKEHQSSADEVNHHLMSLDSFAKRFSASLDLIARSEREYEEAREKRTRDRKAVKPGDFRRYEAVQAEYTERWQLLHLWRSIAQRDAIMTIWDFSTAIYNVRKGLDRCASLDAFVDRPSLEKVLKNLSDAFPNRKQARHASAHPADFTKSKQEMERHSLDGGFEAPGFKISEGAKGTFIYGGSFADGTVVFTYEGAVIKAKITKESLIALMLLRDQMHACFANAENGMRKNMLDRMGLHLPE